MGRCLAYVQAGRLLSAKPNKQQPLELSTLQTPPDASSPSHDWVPRLGQALWTSCCGGFRVTTAFWGFPITGKMPREEFGAAWS